MHPNESPTTGELYLVSLPIGNLADITLRAVDALKSVDYILAEDTRTTRRILDYYHIDTPFFTSVYQGAEQRRIEAVLSLLNAGKDLALVPDAGTPLISDPGYPLVRATIEAGFNVVPIPGPTAAIAAVVASGLPADRFCFEGAVPRTSGGRRAFFERLRSERRTTVVYESIHRLRVTLETLASVLPDRRIVLAREITKVHEQFLRGTAAEILENVRTWDRIRGECVMVIGGTLKPVTPYNRDHADQLLSVLRAEGLSNKSMLRILTSALGIPRNEAYGLIHEDE